MKKAVAALFVLMVLAAPKGRVAWFGEREFESSVESLEKAGYTVKYINTLDEETLSAYDVLVICFAEPTQDQKEAIFTFVEKGGGLLIIYNIISYPTIKEVLAEYELESALENTLEVEDIFVFPFLTQERIEDLKKRIAVSQKGEGRALAVGYDPLTFQTVSLLIDLDSIFTFGVDWLCQDWHVEQTQAQLAKRRVTMVIPVVVVAAALLVGYYVFKTRKPKPSKEADKAGQIRELKAKFVYGELSKDEYHKELEKLERSQE
jgi:hypothetical protein